MLLVRRDDARVAVDGVNCGGQGSDDEITAARGDTVEVRRGRDRERFHRYEITRIDRFAGDLRSGRKDGKWDSADQLAFVINFMGEIHQPLHAITNADMGGKCLGVIAPEPANALHSLWGESLVIHLEHELHTRGPADTAAALQKRFPDTETKLPSIQ